MRISLLHPPHPLRPCLHRLFRRLQDDRGDRRVLFCDSRCFSLESRAFRDNYTICVEIIDEILLQRVNDSRLDAVSRKLGIPCGKLKGQDISRVYRREDGHWGMKTGQIQRDRVPIAKVNSKTMKRERAILVLSGPFR